MAIATTDQFLTALERSNLLSDQEFSAVRHQLAEAGDEVEPQAVARALIRRGLLTRWQAEQLLSQRPSFYLGKYKLTDRIGKGGMGSVYKAQHAMMGRTVALKVMARHLLKDRNAVARFRREVQLAASLNHPNIVIAHDADSVGDTHFLVMEFVEGRDLGRWIKESGPMPIAWSCECIRQAALGLEHAHRRGLVHRDIKPSNLLVTQSDPGGPPLIKILDLGLARFASESVEEMNLTRSGQIVGTPDYIAPEQAEDVKSADVRADIFSLGCTLFHLLTGRVPFQGANLMAKLIARINNPAPAVRGLRGEVPIELEAIVARMLARQPADRFQTPGEVAAALAPFAAGGGDHPPLPSEEDAAPLVALSSGSSVVQSDADSGLNDFLSRLSTTAHGDSDAGDTPSEEATIPDLTISAEAGPRRSSAGLSREVQAALALGGAVLLIALLLLAVAG